MIPDQKMKEEKHVLTRVWIRRQQLMLCVFYKVILKHEVAFPEIICSHRNAMKLPGSCVYAHRYTRTHTHTHTCTHTHACAQKHAHICRYVHIHMHTQIEREREGGGVHIV